MKSLNLKKVSLLEARSIAKTQRFFESENPLVDGIELPKGEICVFPKSVSKLKIKYRDELEDFSVGFEYKFFARKRRNKH